MAVNLTALLGVAAILVTVGTLALLVREATLIAWQLVPLWFRFALLGAVTAGLVLVVQNVILPQ